VDEDDGEDDESNEKVMKDEDGRRSWMKDEGCRMKDEG